MYGFTVWSPSRAQPCPARGTELVPAIKDTGFPTPLAVRKGATCSVQAEATTSGPPVQCACSEPGHIRIKHGPSTRYRSTRCVLYTPIHCSQPCSCGFQSANVTTSNTARGLRRLVRSCTGFCRQAQQHPHSQGRHNHRPISNTDERPAPPCHASAGCTDRVACWQKPWPVSTISARNRGARSLASSRIPLQRCQDCRSMMTRRWRVGGHNAQGRVLGQVDPRGTLGRASAAVSAIGRSRCWVRRPLWVRARVLGGVRQARCDLGRPLGHVGYRRNCLHCSRPAAVHCCPPRR